LCLGRFGSPVYVRHEIVHNPHVVNGLRQKGAVFVNGIEDVPPGETVVFSAHGVAPSVWEEARAKDLRIVDATCPLVTKVHLEAVQYAREGYTIIVVGHQGHDEVVGTMGEVPHQTVLIETVEEAAKVQVKDPTRVVVLTQTTLSVSDTRERIRVLQERFPTLVTRNDICYATTNRQEATKAIAREVDMVLVIGAQNSSNCNRLREVAEGTGRPAYLVNDPRDINETWFAGVERAGIISGASTPELLVTAVIEALRPRHVRTLAVAEENVTFVLPKELRQETRAQPYPSS